MFKLDLKDYYTWPVDVVIADAGKARKFRFDARFTRLSQPEIDTLMKQAGAGNIEDIEFCNRILEGWEGIQDEDGQTVHYSESSKHMLLEVYPVAACIVEAYGKSLSAGRTKNS